MTSATAGMHLLLHTLGIGPGDEVITPSMTWVSTVNLITLSGAKPVFVDVDRDTLMVTAESVGSALTSRTKLIIPVHYAGAPLDLDPLRALAAERGIALIEDAAHVGRRRLHGRPVGAGGTAIFSFHPIKNLTSGEGGMVATDDAELAARMRRLRFHGLGADAYQRESQGRAPQAQVHRARLQVQLAGHERRACASGSSNALAAMNARRSRARRAVMRAAGRISRAWRRSGMPGISR